MFLKVLQLNKTNTSLMRYVKCAYLNIGYLLVHQGNSTYFLCLTEI